MASSIPCSPAHVIGPRAWQPDCESWCTNARAGHWTNLRAAEPWYLCNLNPSIYPSILTHLTEREGGLALRDGRRVVHLADAVLAPALLEAQARVRGVRDDVAADGLGGVLGEAHAVGVGHDLVREHHGDAVLLIRCTRVSSRREQT